MTPGALPGHERPQSRATHFLGLPATWHRCSSWATCQSALGWVGGRKRGETPATALPAPE